MCLIELMEWILTLKGVTTTKRYLLQIISETAWLIIKKNIIKRVIEIANLIHKLIGKLKTITETRTGNIKQPVEAPALINTRLLLVNFKLNIIYLLAL